MAFASDITSNTQSGFGARFNAIIADVRARLARRKLFNETYRELSNLSNRDLADLGLNRSMIRRVAYQAAYDV